MKFGVLGTGMVGNAIATKLVALGHEVMMGSRTGRQRAGERLGRAGRRRAASAGHVRGRGASSAS